MGVNSSPRRLQGRPLNLLRGREPLQTAKGSDWCLCQGLSLHCHRLSQLRDGLENFCNVNMTTNNVNVKMPPMLPTTPLPLNVVTSNVMYMYSCSQCEFKTHIESLFKQHVDSVHLGIPNVPNNMVLGQTSATVAAAASVSSPSVVT